MAIRLHYNAPVILTFSLIATGTYFLNASTNGSLNSLVSVPGNFNATSIMDYLSLFLYVFGHANIDHLLGNMSFMLLLGPIVEEKYGGAKLLIMILLTALVTAILNILFFHEGLWGASGIVFMLILLVSFSNSQQGKIPLTFILILLLFIGKEVYNSTQADNISQFAHIVGGIIGSVFGFLLSKRTSSVN